MSAPVNTPAGAGEWLAAVEDAERRGELLTAFDLAERALVEHPDDLVLKHRAVLALARAGSTQEAARRFAEYGLAGIEDEDIAALEARIAKDVALASEGEDRALGARRSAELYRATYAHTGGYYPAINAATLSLIADDRDAARELAREVLELVRHAGKPSSYYAAATEAEALLLLGEGEAARAALEQAVAQPDADHGAMSTTRKQLRLICQLSGIDGDVLSPLTSPTVVHFCGHRIAAPGGAGRFPAVAEQSVAEQIADEVERHPAAYAYGALASGADILFAEALLAHGAELHIVLPFAREEFVRHSVAPSGAGWVERFERCMDAAAGVLYATDDAFLGDDVLYKYGTELAMGLAVLRARYLDTDAHQLAVWDGGPAAGGAGTAIDVATWQRHGRPVTIIAPGPPAEGDASLPALAPASSTGREVRAVLFADIKGFSKLTDEELPRFSDLVLGAFAEVLRNHGDRVLQQNTWGDALYVVLSDVASAAACACDLQDAIGAIDLAAVRLPGHLALRLGGHVGPVFSTLDPVLGAPAFIGSHVSRTARIEPVTPPGEVYVTEPFAAALALEERDDLPCNYVGHMPAAKDYGRLRMYRLGRRGA